MAGRVLVFSEPFGMGHERAAQALINGMKVLEPGIQAFHTNSIQSTFPRGTRYMTALYLQAIDKFPRLWHRFYENGRRNRENSTSKKLIFKLLAGAIKKAVTDCKPDAVVCTHPFPASVISRLKEQGLSVPLVGIITDYDVHAYWLDQNVDLYIVGHEALIDEFASFKFKPRCVSGEGIPIDPVFRCKPDKEYSRRKLGIAVNVPVILVGGGGWGLGNLDRIVELLVSIPGNYQIVVVTGTNNLLKSKLEARFSRTKNVKIFGLVGNIHEFMSAADVMVTKPGGLTTSEALAMGLPMVLFDVIYGQEEWNARFLSGNEAAVKCRFIEEIPRQVTELLENAGEHRWMVERAMKIRKPNSGVDAARRILQLA